MSNIDWSQLITKEMKEAEAEAAKRVVDAAVEDGWRASEMAVIADQLLAIEDDDPSALPGTEREWRDYRIKVRAWKDGAKGFPDSSLRPERP